MCAGAGLLSPLLKLGLNYSQSLEKMAAQRPKTLRGNTRQGNFLSGALGALPAVPSSEAGAICVPAARPASGSTLRPPLWGKAGTFAAASPSKLNFSPFSKVLPCAHVPSFVVREALRFLGHAPPPRVLSRLPPPPA